MLGFSYGEILLLIGVTAAVIGPKDLPRIARTAGRMAGRAVGYVQLVRGQFDNVMQQSQARQVHKELQDTMAKLDAIRYEIRGLSLINPGPMTRDFMENSTQSSPPPDSGNDGVVSEKLANEEELKKRIEKIVKDNGFRTSGPVDLHAQATSYEKLAEVEALKAASLKKNVEKLGLDDESGLFAVLPVSAETAKMLPNRKDNASGSDILLEAVLEAEVARNAKDFFAEAQNHIPAK